MNAEVQKFNDKQLIDFDVTEAAVATMEKRFLPLKTNGIEDVEAYKEVDKARAFVRDHRLKVERRRKELVEDAVKYQRKVNGEAGTLKERLQTLEDHLKSQKALVDDEKERIRKEAEERERVKIESRMNEAYRYGMVFNGSEYMLNELPVDVGTFKSMSESEFQDWLETVRIEFENRQKAEKEERERKEREEREAREKAEKAQREEEERQAKVKAEQEAKAQELAKKEADLKAKEAAMEAKEQVKQEKPEKEPETPAEVPEKGQAPAATPAPTSNRKTTVDSDAWERDKKKLLGFADSLKSVYCPNMETEDGVNLKVAATSKLMELVSELQETVK